MKRVNSEERLDEYEEKRRRDLATRSETESIPMAQTLQPISPEQIEKLRNNEYVIQSEQYILTKKAELDKPGPSSQTLVKTGSNEMPPSTSMCYSRGNTKPDTVRQVLEGFDSTVNDKPNTPKNIPDSAKITVLSNIVLSPKLKMSQIQSWLQNVELPVQQPEAPFDEPIDINQVVDHESYLKYFSKENALLMQKVKNNKTENNAAELNDDNSGIEYLPETPQFKFEIVSNQELGSSTEGNDINEVQSFIPIELLEEIMICDDGEMPNLLKLLPDNDQGYLQQVYDNPSEHLEDLCSLIERSMLQLENTDNSDPVDPTNEHKEDSSSSFSFQYLWGLAHGFESGDVNNVTPPHNDIKKDDSPESLFQIYENIENVETRTSSSATNDADLDYCPAYEHVNAYVGNEEMSIYEYERLLEAEMDFVPEYVPGTRPTSTVTNAADLDYCPEYENMNAYEGNDEISLYEYERLLEAEMDFVPEYVPGTRPTSTVTNAADLDYCPEYEHVNAYVGNEEMSINEDERLLEAEMNFVPEYVPETRPTSTVTNAADLDYCPEYEHVNAYVGNEEMSINEDERLLEAEMNFVPETRPSSTVTNAADLNYCPEYENMNAYEGNDEISLYEYERLLEAEMDFVPEYLPSSGDETDEGIDISDFLSVSLFYSSPEDESN